jgi:hypothetical protein
MVLYDDNVSLTESMTITNLCVEFITAFFNNNKKCLHIVNIDFLTSIQSSTLQALMNKYNFKLIFLESTTINDTQINHKWTNASIQQCHFESTQAYCTNYKSIYFAFKLPDYVPQFVLPYNITK